MVRTVSGKEPHFLWRMLVDYQWSSSVQHEGLLILRTPGIPPICVQDM